MTRIVAGYARSTRLDVPSQGTRPTSDRVREALFSALDARGVLNSARVLDLYSGSGALGLEAVSRGAADAVLVDNSSVAAKICRRNTAAVLRAITTDTTPTVTTVRTSATTYLANCTDTFDVVFVDPPYRVTTEALTGVLVDLAPHLSDGALVIVERDRRSDSDIWPSGYEPLKQTRYGETVLWWAERYGSHPPVSTR